MEAERSQFVKFSSSESYNFYATKVKTHRKGRW